MTMQCKYCRRDIHINATKCYHCGESQNERANTIRLWSLYIGFVVTLTSLMTLAVTSLKEHFMEKTPNISAVITGGGGNNIQFTVFNAGNAPAIIVGATVSFHDKQKNSYTSILKSESLPKVVAGSENFLVDAFGPDNINLPLQLMFGIESKIGNPLKEVCTLSVTYRDFGGVEVTVPISYKCLAG